MIIARAPVRISFFGGGTDYPEHFLQEGGAVLATAIDKFSYITASTFLSHLFDYAIRLSYRQNELVRQVDEIKHNVFRECLKLIGPDRGVELHAVADLPAFTGLGSSSAFTVSLLHALHSFKGQFLPPLDLAYEAIHVERHLLGDRVGCQDQVMAAVGGLNLVEFRTEREILVRRVPITPERQHEFEQHLFVVFSGIRRKAADVVASQLARMKDNRSMLSEMKSMAFEGWDILTTQRPLAEFGALLHEAWYAKRSLDGGISNVEIDAIYEAGRRAGALGGKLLGAGGGGFVLFFAPPQVHPRLAEVFRSQQILNVRCNAPGSEIIFSTSTEPSRYLGPDR